MLPTGVVGKDFSETNKKLPSQHGSLCFPFHVAGVLEKSFSASASETPQNFLLFHCRAQQINAGHPTAKERLG